MEAAVAVAEPTTVELKYPAIEPRVQRHLQLIYHPTGRVVTVMELLSPINKAPREDGLEAYLEKRAEFLASGCHLIEFDLLRGGERLPMAGPLPKGDYVTVIDLPILNHPLGGRPNPLLPARLAVLSERRASGLT